MTATQATAPADQMSLAAVDRMPPSYGGSETKA